MKNTKTKKYIAIAVAATVGAVVLLLVLAVIVSWLKDTREFRFSLVHTEIWIFWASAVVVSATVILFNYLRSSRRVLAKNKDLEDAHWLTRKEIESNDSLTVTKLTELGKANAGVPVFAKKKGRDVDIVIAKPNGHTLVIGTTGSGKTTTFVDPTAQILPRTKTQPCVVFTDPKGEIYRHHAATYSEYGYELKVIDLNDVFRSTKWNPFHDVYRKTERMRDARIENKAGKYYFDDMEYATFDEADKERLLLIQTLDDEIYQDIQDLIYTLCPTGDEKNAFWQQGARDLIFAVAVALWEDLRDGIIQKEHFNLFELYMTVKTYAVGECAELKEYFNRRSEFSKAPGLANAVLVAESGDTRSSFLTHVNQYVAFMADSGIQSLTSGNEIEFDGFDEKPTALFIKIPDEKANRHKLVTLFVTQMYKALIAKAKRNEKRKETKSEELKRPAYFIMDEFANLPKFNNIGQIVKVGRSRGIVFIPIIQDFASLDIVYGKDTANTIKSNCNIKIFIQSGDLQTTKEFSELCGKHKVKRTAFSDSSSATGSVSTSAEERPLIPPSELQKLNDAAAGRMGEAIVLALGKNPLRATFTPVFQATGIYKWKDTLEPLGVPSIFNPDAHYFDIAKRNAFIRIDERLGDDSDEEYDEPTDDDYFDEDEENERIEAEAAARVGRDLDAVELMISQRLGNKLTPVQYRELTALSMPKKIACLAVIIEKAAAERNNILLFDAAAVKTFIAGILAKYDVAVSQKLPEAAAKAFGIDSS